MKAALAARQLPLARGLLLPLVPVYATVVALKNLLRERGVLRHRRLAHPVISVGSISAGGAGKTPVVIMLAELLQESGFEVRILTRGYRRNGVAILRVDPEGDAGESGDEPMLMARRLRTASVWVGTDRHRAGLRAEKEDRPRSRVVYLLDDGFQHRKLARDVDIVLLTRQDIGDRLLPAGNLREPLKAVRRADIVLVREDEADAVYRAGPGRVWMIRRRLEFPAGLILPQRPVVFCGLARPEGFLAMLAAEGVVPVVSSIFPDHHTYTARDVEGLVNAARANNADGFLTTDKDAVKLTVAMTERLRAVGPVVVPELRVELLDEESRTKELLGMLAAKADGSGRSWESP